MATNTVPDFISYDFERRVITIFGVKYSQELFEGLGFMKSGDRFECVHNEAGSFALKRLTDIRDEASKCDEREQ